MSECVTSVHKCKLLKLQYSFPYNCGVYCCPMHTEAGEKRLGHSCCSHKNEAVTHTVYTCMSKLNNVYMTCIGRPQASLLNLLGGKLVGSKSSMNSFRTSLVLQLSVVQQ